MSGGGAGADGVPGYATALLNILEDLDAEKAKVMRVLGRSAAP